MLVVVGALVVCVGFEWTGGMSLSGCGVVKVDNSMEVLSEVAAVTTSRSIMPSSSVVLSSTT